MGYIYKISNTINPKVYIGLTRVTVHARWLQHLNNVKNNPVNELYQDMNRYGIDNFYIETIEQCNEDILSEREKYWIKYYDSFNNGYNNNQGGVGTPRCDEQLIINLWDSGYTLKQITKETGYNVNTIKERLRIYDKNFDQKSYDLMMKQLCKPISQYTLNGDYIQTFDSVKEAQRKCGLNHNTLDKVISGKTNCCNGFQWRFGYDTNNIGRALNKHNRNTPIIQYDLNGNIVNIFPNIKIASKATGVNNVGICNVCRGISKTSGGYKWEYYYDYTGNKLIKLIS